MVEQLTNPPIDEHETCILVECFYKDEHWWRCKLLDPEEILYPLSPVCDYADSGTLEELKVWCDMRNLHVRYVIPYHKYDMYRACACTRWCSTFNG